MTVSDLKKPSQPITPEQWADIFVGITDVLYCFGQHLAATGHTTRQELAGILDRMLEAQKTQDAKANVSPGSSAARGLCAATLRDSFAAVNPHEPTKAPTVQVDGNGELQ